MTYCYGPCTMDNNIYQYVINVFRSNKRVASLFIYFLNNKRVIYKKNGIFRAYQTIISWIYSEKFAKSSRVVQMMNQKFTIIVCDKIKINNKLPVTNH